MKLLEEVYNNLDEELIKILNNYNEKDVVKYIEKELKTRKDKISFLEDMLILAKGFYYEEGIWLQEKFNISPLIPDYFYDKLEEVFNKLTNGEIEVGLKTNIVKGEFPKYKHTRLPGVSQHKTNKKDDIEKFIKNKNIENEEFVVSEKLDGSSLYLIYDKNGKLLKGVTRGDGEEGNDITINIKDIEGIKKEIDISLYPEGINFVEIRGEVILTKENLKKINENTNLNYKNTRNAIPGILMSPYNNNSKYLTFMAYEEIMELENGKIIENNTIDKFNNLKKFNFKLPFYKKINNIKELFDIYKEYVAEKRKELDYDIDGLVVTINDTIKKQELGFSNRKSNGSFAFKFPADMVHSRVKTVHFQLGDASGNITPVVEIEPVDIEGVTVSKINLANYALFESMALSVGDEVFIRRSGDVIPQIVKNSKFDNIYKDIYKIIDEVLKEKIDEKVNEKIEDIILNINYLDKTPLQFEIMTKINKELKELNNKSIEKNIYTNIINKVVLPEIKKIINKQNLNKDEKKSLFDEYKNKFKEKLKEADKEVRIDKLYENKIEFTSNCPSCGSQLSNNGTISKCINPGCEGRKIGSIITFIEKSGVKGIKKSTITFLYENNLIQNLDDLFKIKKDDFYDNDGNIKYKGWGEKKIDNLLSGIEELKNMEAHIFLGSLGIENFSISNFEKLLDNFSFEDIINNKITEEEYKKIGGFDKTVKGLIEELDNKKELIDNLLKHINIKESEKNETNENSIKMYFTGAVKGLNLDGTEINKKEELYNYLKDKSNNLIVPTSKFNKKNCDILVYNGAKTSKIDKAKKMNIPVFTLNELLENINNDKLKKNLELKEQVSDKLYNIEK